MMFALTLALVCVMLGGLVLWLHRRRVLIDYAHGRPLVDVGGGGRICAACATKQVASSTAPLAQHQRSQGAAVDPRLSEAIVRRKRQWLVQRGEGFLRQVMLGQRSASLAGDHIRSNSCSMCRTKLPHQGATTTTHHHKKDEDALDTDIVGCAIDMTDVALERQEAHYRQRYM